MRAFLLLAAVLSSGCLEAPCPAHTHEDGAECSVDPCWYPSQLDGGGAVTYQPALYGRAWGCAEDAGPALVVGRRP